MTVGEFVNTDLMLIICGLLLFYMGVRGEGLISLISIIFGVALLFRVFYSNL